LVRIETRDLIYIDMVLAWSDALPCFIWQVYDTTDKEMTNAWTVDKEKKCNKQSKEIDVITTHRSDW
jgi:hypothetical protein